MYTIPSPLSSEQEIKVKNTQLTLQARKLCVSDPLFCYVLYIGYGNDNVEIQATNPFTLSISDPSYGTVRGSWTYDNPDKIVNKVALTMELQYRTSFLDLTWDTIDSYNFIYGGGLGSHEGNEHTFRISDKGQYRVKILGQVSFIGGHHDVLMYSGVRSYEGGGIIISDEPEAK